MGDRGSVRVYVGRLVNQHRLHGWAARDLAIWGYAFGYFACYAPYTALTKAVTDGRLPRGGAAPPPSGFELLPATVLASMVGMILFLTLMGWWRHAGRARLFGVSLPCPGRYTFISGLCTAGIIATTTLAYTFQGVSIVFVMLLMRGGLLVLAPIVDILARRRVRWFSWMALLLTFGALIVSFSERSGYRITSLCLVDVAIYLTCYFVRLSFMSRLAKSDIPDANLRYFVEEQIIGSPALLLLLAIGALIGEGPVLGALRDGFTSFWDRTIVLHAIAIGLLSQGTGIFGGLILLDRRENSYCVPVNRASSVLAGVVASYGLLLYLGYRAPSHHELIGAALIILAILFLTIPPMREKARARLESRDGSRPHPRHHPAARHPG